MTRLLAAGRQSRSWEEMIVQITSAEDRAKALRLLLELQGRLVAGEYGVLWELTGAGELVPSMCWPMAQVKDVAPPILQMLHQSARISLERGVSQVLKIEVPGQTGDTSGHIFATVLRIAGKPAAVATIVAGVHDPQVIPATAAQRELAAGLYEVVQTRQDLRSAVNEAERVRQAMAVLAVVQDGQGFHGACLNLVNELARLLKADRVSLGWMRGRSLRLEAVSDAEQVKKKSTQATQLEMAMAECLDQQQPIVHPIDADAEPVLAQAVVYSHRQLCEGTPGKHVMSIPLRQGETWVGVLTLERQGPPPDAALIARLQLIADVIAPQLADRRQSDQWIWGHAWSSVRRSAAWVVGPKHVGWKLAGLLALTVLGFVLLASWPYRITANFQLVSMERRVVSAPYKARLREVLVQPNDAVVAGQVLARLDPGDLLPQLASAKYELDKATVMRDQAMADPSKRKEAEEAAAQVREYQEKVKGLTELVDQATLRSPQDGTVLAGDWQHKKGDFVDPDHPMFEISPLRKLTAVLRVDERDVHDILDAQGRLRPDLVGELATRAEPERTFVIRPQRVVPQAHTAEGGNVFDVWCEVENQTTSMRPGMEGVAKMDVGRRRLFWILTHRIVDAARLWLWW